MIAASSGVFAAETPAADNYVFSIMPLPAFNFTPETGWGFGVAALYAGSPESQSLTAKQDTGIFSILYTQKKQLQFDLQVEKYFDNGLWYFHSQPIFNYYPSQTWGLGPNTLTSESENFIYTEGGITASLLRNIAANMMLGGYYKFNKYTTTDLLSGGMLDSGALSGGHGALMSALGIRYIFDSRDRRFSPGSGYVADFKLAMSLKALGASADFYSFESEGKAFYTPFAGHYLCFDAILRLTGKGAPFRYVPSLGGMYYMRGYYSGRYVDYAYTAAETEYRFPLFWTFRGNVFATIGQVGGDITKLSTNNIKAAWGVGLHWTPFDFMDSPLRFELAFANKDMQFYIDLVEAF